MITAADLGDPNSPTGEIHPRNKKEVGRRLALAATSSIYGANPIPPFLGPFNPVVSVNMDSTFGYSLSVTFDDASVGSGLTLQSPQVCPEWSEAVSGGCGYIYLVYPSPNPDSRKLVNASVELVSYNTVRFVPTSTVDSNVAPVEIQYCLGDYPLMTIYNSYGIPLLPNTIVV